MDVHHIMLSGALARQVGSDIEGMTGEISWIESVDTPDSAFAAEVIGGHYLTKMALDAAERGAADAGELASLAAFHAASALGVVDVTELLQIAAEASGNLAGGLVDA